MLVLERHKYFLVEKGSKEKRKEKGEMYNKSGNIQFIELGGEESFINGQSEKQISVFWKKKKIKLSQKLAYRNKGGARRGTNKKKYFGAS